MGKLVGRLCLLMTAFFLFLGGFYRDALAGTVFTINGDNGRVGDTFSIIVRATDACTQYKRDITGVEIALNAWAGDPKGYSVDFIDAQITTTYNGQPLSGSRRHTIHPSGFANSIVLHLSSPLVYKNDGSALIITVTNAKRRYPGEGGLHAWLLEEPLQDNNAMFSGCSLGMTVQEKYVGQAAESRKAEGLPLEGPVPQVTKVDSQVSNDTQTEIKLTTATPTISASITPLSPTGVDIRSQRDTTVKVNKSLIGELFDLLRSIFSRVGR